MPFGLVVKSGSNIFSIFSSGMPQPLSINRIQAKLASELVKVEAHGEDWVRYFAPNPRETNPRLLQLLAARGEGVVTLSEVSRSLEDVYLRVVEEV